LYSYRPVVEPRFKVRRPNVAELVELARRGLRLILRDDGLDQKQWAEDGQDDGQLD
jgi:hypothetical protein